jgi:hypothetical protein
VVMDIWLSHAATISAIPQPVQSARHLFNAMGSLHNTYAHDTWMSASHNNKRNKLEWCCVRIAASC